ncbi:hypothetical protein R6Q59_003498 [Mikania micrantha]|uniref:Uncharacterized protein n=1 Tax=Mikania micrantha TaxID=192012 RepID=A0A5N6ML84_9ASTR|nr:hypothetical protein E3N88_30035 [Mikania micrantha]
MERLTRSFSTTSVDINKGWRRKVYDGKTDGCITPDLRKDHMKTARFGETHHGRFWKIKKLLFNLDPPSEQQQSNKIKHKSKISRSNYNNDEFENRLMYEIYKNLSASHELSSMYN